MKKTKVLHLLTSNDFSGAENVVCTIIENEDREKYDMYYCSRDGKIRDILKKRGIKFLPINFYKPLALKKLAHKYDIDIIHAHDFIASTIAATSGFKGKIISHIHCNPAFIKKWNIFSRTYATVSPKFSSVIFVSDEGLQGTVFADKIKNKSVVITNVVDKERINRLSNEIEVKENYDIVFLGRLIDLKQPKLVIEVTKELKKKNKNIKTCMIGQGVLEEECKNLIKEYNLEDNIDMKGFMTNPFPYVKNTKVALMPSKYEGLGMSAIECMILNVPVLNSGAGGLSGLFKGNEDFICKNEKDYINKITKMNDKDYYLKFQNKCKDIITDYVDTTKYIDKINNIYERK